MKKYLGLMLLLSCVGPHPIVKPYEPQETQPLQCGNEDGGMACITQDTMLATSENVFRMPDPKMVFMATDGGRISMSFDELFDLVRWAQEERWRARPHQEFAGPHQEFGINWTGPLSITEFHTDGGR
jgi:hypothetical protein